MSRTARGKGHNVKGRIRAFLIDNVGKVVTREEIQEAARDPETGRIPENWHQRLSELRCDEGYDIYSWRDRKALKPDEYMLAAETPTRVAKPRGYLSASEKQQLFERNLWTCQWPGCGLKDGDTDPVGGGRVVLTADHVSPHSLSDGHWTGTLDDWQTLCARHQQEKKNLIDDRTGRKNIRELVRVSGEEVKREIYEALKMYFGEN